MPHSMIVLNLSLIMAIFEEYGTFNKTKYLFVKLKLIIDIYEMK